MGPYSIIPLEYGGNDPHLRLSKSLSTDCTGALLIRRRADDIGMAVFPGNCIASYFLRRETPTCCQNSVAFLFIHGDRSKSDEETNPMGKLRVSFVGLKIIRKDFI